MKKKIFILIGITVLLFALDFVPVKFAKKDTDVIIDNEKYVFCYEPKTSGLHSINWVACGYKEGKEDFDLPWFEVIIDGYDPYDSLSNFDFDPIDLYNHNKLQRNRFVLRGEMNVSRGDLIKNVIDIESEGWDILYPVNRLSFRRFYVPANYLTVYDFDWIKVIKSIFE